MSKFNENKKGIQKVQNHEGAEVYDLDDKVKLYSVVVTSLLSDKFYESAGEELERIKELVRKVSSKDPLFVAKLAVYAREEMYLRSIPLVLVTELAKVHNGDDLVSKAVGRVVKRADEITELLSYYAVSNGRDKGGIKKLNKLSKQIQKGLNLSFNRFNEFLFSKYNRKKEISLKDALFIVHPKAKDSTQQEIFDKITHDELKTPDTWEVELSSSKDKKVSWERLINEEKLGYMALLRNLKNILEAKVSKKHIIKVAKTLSDKEAVLHSKQFPFRFWSAYNKICNVKSGLTSVLLDALEEAIVHSSENIKGFDYETSVLVSVDTSGSMGSSVSDRSTIKMQDVGLVLGSLLHQRCKNVETSIFGLTYKIINLPKKNILSNVSTLSSLSGSVGHSTNGYLILEDLIKRGEIKDKIFIFTDMQMYNSEDRSDFPWDRSPNIGSLWVKYKKIAPNAKIYFFDLAGYGNIPLSIRGNDVYLISGWSEKIFEALDAGDNAALAMKKIEEIVL